MTEHPGAFEGRTLADPGFAADDGSAPPEITDALSHASSTGDVADLVSALHAGRVLVPVVALLGETDAGPDGLVRDKGADMAVVTVRAPNGRLGLPAFTSAAALAAWNPEGRPVPVVGRLAALAAYDEGADALLLDPAGPVRFVLEGPGLVALAEGRRLLPPLEDPAVRTAVDSAVRAAGLAAHDVRLLPGSTTDLVVQLTVAEDADVPAIAAQARELGRFLAEDPVLRARLGAGLDLEVVRAVT